MAVSRTDTCPCPDASPFRFRCEWEGESAHRAIKEWKLNSVIQSESFGKQQFIGSLGTGR